MSWTTLSWRPTPVRTRPWSEITRMYGEIWNPWTAHVWMKRLCEHIERAPYGGLIFGATSMHTLLVGQHETLEWMNDMLRVDPAQPHRITFSFHERAFVDPVVWACAPDAVIETFERFIRRVKWVSVHIESPP